MAYALIDAGTAYAWGNGDHGQLGNGTTASTEATPSRLHGTTSRLAISAGFYATYALTLEGPPS